MTDLAPYRHEANKIIRLALPILLAQLSQSSMGFVDTIMAGRVGAVDLAAVAVGSSLFFPVYLFLVGLLSAVTPLTAQAHGRRDKADIMRSFQQGVVAGVSCGLITMIIIWQLPLFLPILKVSPEIIPPAKGYLFAISLGMPFAGVFLALRSGGEGLSMTRLSMLTGFAGLLINIAANYIFIFGKLGLPAMGGVGCGWASAIAIIAMMLTMIFLLHKGKVISIAGLCRLEPGLLKSMQDFFALGLPIGLSLFVECSIFAMISLLIARFGAKIVAAHQIALNFTSLLFIVPLSLSMALAIRVGFLIGRKQAANMKRAVLAGLALAVFCSCLTGSFIVGLADIIVRLYTDELPVQEMAVHLLFFAALFQLSDAVQVNCAGALRGCKDTKIPMLLMVLAYWVIGLPIGYGLGILGWGGMTPGAKGFWIGLICGLTISAILLGRRLYTVVMRLAKEI
ncbi:MAG: MATE family efflux transporter [Deltaproteobacteria bacterium]|nr:MAG: MATE family efflux transporter [Deltaproteobacteria bacterium]